MHNIHRDILSRMSSPLHFAVDVARQTGEMLLSKYELGGISADFKNDHTAVTRADIAADNMICEAIQNQFPEDLILSEESNPGNYAEDRAIWIIDPIDGTANFAMGLPIWGISIARVVDGLPQVGVLNFPVVGELFAAERGKGVTLNEQPMSPIVPGEHTVTPFFSCCSRTIRRYKVDLPYKARIMGAAAYTFTSVARGNAAIGFQTKTRIWDIAAGWLIVEESGKEIEVFIGRPPFPLMPDVDYENDNFPIIMAANPELITLARKKLLPFS